MQNSAATLRRALVGLRMNSKNTDTPDENADASCVRQNANKFRVLQREHAKTFPADWKLLCRSVLEAYKTVRQDELGYKRLGWTIIRDEIMSRVDSKSPDGRVERDDRLTRQDIEAWQNGSDLSDTKFQFVDLFIRRLEMDERYENLFEEIQASKFMYQMSALAELYLPKTGNEFFANLIREDFPKYIVSEKIENAWFSQIAAKVQYEFDRVFKLVFLYLPKAIEDIEDRDFQRIAFFEGYVLPLMDVAPSDSKIQRGKTRCLVKLCRAEVRGVYVLGYADGEISFTVTRVSGQKFTEIVLDYPNTILHPAIDGSDRHNRYHPTDIISKSAKDRASRSWEEKSSYEQMQEEAYQREEYRWRLQAESAEKYNEKIDRILQSSYKGYLF